MYIKIIKVTPKIFRTSQQVIFSACNVDMQVIPTKGDKIFIENKEYKVLQRDIYYIDDFTRQHITLFVEEM